jgi:hypothetical protein
MSGKRTRRKALRIYKAQEYRMPCGGLMLTARQGSGGWISTIDGPTDKYVAIKTDEGRAKKACIEVATTILKRRGAAIPECLTRPRWIST